MAVFGQRVRQTTHNIQCLYNLDRRVHAVKAYPILSPQGANIVIYGHENGFSIVWRGGRRLTEAQKAEPKPAAKSDSVMILDSDSEGEAPSASASATSAAFVDKPVFEDAPADAIAGGFPEVVQTLDLALGTAVLHVAVLPLAHCAAKDAEPSLLQEQMVFAITCATTDAYVVTLPLTPPSHESKARPQLRTSLLAGNAGRGAFGDVLIPLGGQAKRSEGVALALARQKTPAAPTAAGTSAAGGRTSTASPPTRVIVAAHSREASGALRLWDITIGAKRASPERPIEPFQTEFLPGPLTDVAFNPTHPTQLLAVHPQQAVRIYDYTVPSILTEDMSESPFPLQGSWLLSLYPPFVWGTGAAGTGVTAPRKPIVAAAWIAHGHAILALLADGQWGIWDIDRASTSSSSSRGGVFGATPATSGIRGAALTIFTVSGQIEGTTPLRNPVAGGRKSTEGDFVPMTPHTRRDALSASFSGGVERLVALRGGVEVVQQRSSRGTTAGKESAVLWLGGADYIVAVISDVSGFWDAELRRTYASGGNMFSRAQQPNMVRLTDLSGSLQGERCLGASVVAWLPQKAPLIGKSTGEDDDEKDDGPAEKDQPLEIFVQGESRLVAVRESEGAAPGSFAARLLTSSLKRRTGDTVGSSAILVEPRARKPGTVKFALNAHQPLGGFGSPDTRGSQRGPPPPAAAGRESRRPPLTKSLFESPSRPAPSTSAALTPQRPLSQRSLFPEDEVTMTQSMMRPQQGHATRLELAFAGDLEEAANASDDEEAAKDRNVEEEMLDIMEIDRELEALEERRDSGAQNVFFEGA